MNIAIISGTVKKIGFRGIANNSQLVADVVMDVVDDVNPENTVEIWFTDRSRAKQWRNVKVGDFAEVTCRIRPALGFTKNGNVAHECTLDPRSFRTRTTGRQE